MGVADVRRLKILEEENRHLKQLVARLSLEKQVLQDVQKKGSLLSSGNRPVAETVLRVSERRVCRLLECHSSVYRYQSCKDEQAVLRMRIREIAQPRISYGCRRIHIMLQREGWKVNHKRVYRLCKLEGLVNAKQFSNHYAQPLVTVGQVASLATPTQ